MHLNSVCNVELLVYGSLKKIRLRQYSQSFERNNYEYHEQGGLLAGINTFREGQQK